MALSPRTSLNRRSFLKQLTAGVAAAPFVTRGLMAQMAAGTIRHASFGAAGMAWVDVTAIAKHPAVTVVAACDVDLNRTVEFRKKFPDARIYQDFGSFSTRNAISTP
jgi:hypothetical protein